MKYLGLFSIILFTACSGESKDANLQVNESETSSTAQESKAVTTNNETLTMSDESENLDSAPESLTTIEYYEVKHAFGNVFYPSENLYTFKFKNTGDNPLIISDAKASCGCTIPNKPEEPIMPGEEGELDVIFRPKEGQVGSPVTKKITVTANTEPKETYLEISAQVVESM